jgi:hypothetical protein
MNIEFSRRLALLFGLILPVVETVRRSRQLSDLRVWPFWLDDWIIGAFLLYGAWQTKKDVRRGQPYLTAAWGFACAMVYTSFFFQLANLGQPDPSGFSPAVVVTIKGIGFALFIAALVAAFRAKQQSS